MVSSSETGFVLYHCTFSQIDYWNGVVITFTDREIAG